MTNKTVDVYLPLDERDVPNKVVWPIALQQLKHLCKIIHKCGWVPRVLNPDKPVQSVAEGISRYTFCVWRSFYKFYCCMGIS